MATDQKEITGLTMTMRLENVDFTVNSQQLVKNLCLSVQPGELSVIIGPNGAGKSTALALLAGDLPPTAGKVYFDQTQLKDTNPLRLARKRAVLPQLSHSNFAFTALDIVLMGRIPHEEAPENKTALRIAQSVMGETDTRRLANQDISTLSGGERQRVNLARVLAQVWSDDHCLSSPKFLLLDEPISALDPKHQVNILTLLRSYADRGYGVMCVLHDMAMAAMFADKIHIMNAGECVQAGSPETVMTADILSNVWQVPFAIQKIGNKTQPVMVIH
ncbi:heme ABC transporter ATP-binding protein [Kordiimonas sp. SCSIO 12610]|uniref:heme ABC transporter ATP-binding protein n=1 Tax=Kordiimonas sp. SCSIO 12610 TaxID=2829597 RepID=UPI00210BE640|nr:heme ABC transporter ATP-binding protein [Kordiimonas sp. SCSIO 12610]UTW55667.1 heme ABC transporter ATP-binding protein [Kordiimonas sp. SCSIO 12610]